MYVRGWFACDVMTSVPLDRLLCMTAVDGAEYIRFVKLFRWIKVTGGGEAPRLPAGQGTPAERSLLPPLLHSWPPQ